MLATLHVTPADTRGVRVRLRGSWKQVVLWSVVTFVLFASSAQAFAAEAAAFELSEVLHLLPGGVPLGTVTDVRATTSDFQGSGPCATENMPSGYPHAAVYRTTTSTRSLLNVEVADDLGGSLSLCRVALYKTNSGLSDPFDADQRDALLVDETDGCATSSGCALETWLAADNAFLLVLWAAPPASGGGAPRDASFVFDSSVKAPSGLGVRVSGHRIREACTGYHEVVPGRRFTVTALSSLGAPVTFLLERSVSGSWTTVASYERAPSGGLAALMLQAVPSGRLRLTVGVPGTDERLDGLERLLLHYLTPRWKRYADGGVRLRVPWYHQRYRLSCEAATLRMAHNYHDPGSISSDWQVLRVIGIDRRRRSGNRWGNPNKMFVGSPTGRMMKTGYGVHYGPVATAASRYDVCRPAVRLRRPSRQAIARYLNDGYPVIVWGAHRGPGGIRRVRWRAWDGTSVTAYSVEHTWVVIGFRGSVSNPTHFIVHDPSGRARRTISLSQFWAFTRYFRTGVVVRG